jgi:hypothetical protein
MSAAAARRRKQLLAKKKATDEGVGGVGHDAIIVRLNGLLAQSSEAAMDEAKSFEEAEAFAYEALQLAQSQVRKYVKNADGIGAFDMASRVVVNLLNSKGRYIGMASQLTTQMVDALTETRTEVNDHILEQMKVLDLAFTNAFMEEKKGIEISDSTAEMDKEDPLEVYERLKPLHVAFLRKVIKYTDTLGTQRFGDMSIHALLAQCCWDSKEYAEATLHFCLAERPEDLATLLMTTPDLPANKPKAPALPAAERDVLLTRGVLYFLAVENLRDANVLLRKFIKLDDGRDPEKLAKSFLDKNNKFQTHLTFSSSLVRICETDAAPLFQWLLRAFAKELGRFPDLQPYTTKIGRVYFGIEPPPSMMSMMENMMGMMGGGGGGAGGMNPAMMAQMMGGGGGF